MGETRPRLAASIDLRDKSRDLDVFPVGNRAIEEPLKRAAIGGNVRHVFVEVEFGIEVLHVFSMLELTEQCKREWVKRMGDFTPPHHTGIPHLPAPERNRAAHRTLTQADIPHSEGT
jgi:hypothetical protein